MMPSLLGKYTNLELKIATDKEDIQPNHIYFIPGGKTMTIQNNTLFLIDRNLEGLVLSIDIFFASLAKDKTNKCAGVILSGTGLGLANCKKIVGIHNREIWVKSQEGQGASFSFSISKTNKRGTTKNAKLRIAS